MMKLKAKTALLCVVFMLCNFLPAAADNADTGTPTEQTQADNQDETKVQTDTKKEALPLLKLTVTDAVKTGLENSIDLKNIDNQVALAQLSLDKANSNVKDLERAKISLNNASALLSKKKGELSDAQSKLNSATTAINSGIAPQDIPLTDASGNAITDASGNALVIKAGQNISGYLSAVGLGSLSQTVVDKVKSQLSSSQETLNSSAKALEEGESTLINAGAGFSEALADASSQLSTKINIDNPTVIGYKNAEDLMMTVAGVNFTLTEYAKDIYKNQIAMLIQKNYYDALYAQKLLEYKNTAMERGKKQLDVVQLSYENGMKAKDDYLLAQMYYTSTVMEYQQQQGVCNNALYELKRNMNLDLATPVELTDNMISEVTEENLEDGLKSALDNRLEVKKALGQVTIYSLNNEIAQNAAYEKSAIPPKEAKLMLEKSQIALQAAEQDVSKDVHQSYETLTATGNMLKSSEGLVENAEEVVKIAQLKYEQGMGAENSLLKQLNISESTGTVVELIAAEEQLAKIQSQVSQLIYGYTMASIKYQNDIGVLPYE